MGQLKDEDGDPVPIDPADLPPALGWEQGAYEVYELTRTQWQYTMAGRASFQYERAERLADLRGYDIELFIDLLRAIEYAELKNDQDQRDQERQKRGG